MMEPIFLRPYQQEAMDAILASPSRRQLVAMPTGLGKTILFLSVAKHLQTPTLILVHRDELVNQTIDKASAVWPESGIGIIKAERNELGYPLTVASVQTISRSARLSQIVDGYGLIITDEAHHSPAQTYLRIYKRLGIIPPLSYPDDDASLNVEPMDTDGLHLGVTATPNRKDKIGLAKVFDTVVYDQNILDFIPEYLADLRIVQIQTRVEVDGVPTLGDDLNPGALGKLLNTDEVNSELVEKWKEHAGSRKMTLAFCCTIAHAHALAEMFQAHDIDARAIDHEMPLPIRRQLLSDFQHGKFPVLTNVGILTEGYDNPAIDCILMARPTTSESLFVQMVGRGTRRLPVGKDDCLILDVACNSAKHELISPLDLFGLEKADGTETVTEAREAAAQRAFQLTLEKLEMQEQLVLDTRQKLDAYSPNRLAWVANRWGAWTLSLGSSGKIRITESKESDRFYVMQIVGKQTDWLTSQAVSISHALMLAESHARRYNLSIADRDATWRKEIVSEKQLALLRQYQIPHAHNISRGDASDLLTMYFEGGIS